jgi:hypothetical protein
MKGKKHSYEGYFQILKPALISKSEELLVLGYGDISVEKIWGFLTKKKWRKTKEDIHVYELINDLLASKPGEIMNYITVEAFKGENLLSDLREDELRDLLYPLNGNNTN